MIHTERINQIGKPQTKGQYFVYWMQQSQRIQYNHALQYAIRLANDKKLPLLVYFLIQSYPEANLRHYDFMTKNLFEIKEQLKDMNINMVIDCVNQFDHLQKICLNAHTLITDKGYLKIQRLWRKQVQEKITCSYTEVESDALIPIETLSNKEEYSAFTLRKKAVKLIEYFLKPLDFHEYQGTYFQPEITPTIDIQQTGEDIINKLSLDNSVKPSLYYLGGESEAQKLLLHFLNHKLDIYHEKRNDPSLDYLSNLSPYLHFGQISPLDIALQTIEHNKAGSASFLEELIIRRELAINFVWYNPNYNQFQSLPAWSRQTLMDHISDKRFYLYSPDELERAETHDIYWNAAQKEMLITGKMHGYMRMYWGKKIIEWSENPEDAFYTALYLNNKYELDGRDPNAYAGIAWCFGKHDRPWTSREIFGTVRYMNAAGLKRKFDMDAYVRKIEALS